MVSVLNLSFSFCALRADVLLGGQFFLPRGQLTIPRDIFGCHSSELMLGSVAAGVSWAEAREAEYVTVHRIALCHRGYPVQSVSSVQIEKTRCKRSDDVALFHPEGRFKKATRNIYTVGLLFR